MKILLWKLGAIGDLLMTTPLLRQVRRANPQARIDYLAGSRSAPILAGHPAMDHLLTFDERILIDRDWRRLPEIVSKLQRYDLVFVLDKHWIFGVLAAWARVPCRIGFARRTGEGAFHTRSVSYGPVRHEIDYYLDLLAVTGQSVDCGDRAMDAPAAEGIDVPADFVVLINSGGDNVHERSAVRQMPRALFEPLVDAVAREQHVVFLGSAREAANYQEFSRSRTINLCGKTSLAQATAVLRQAKWVCTTDTGLMHLAGAVNTKVTAVFGPTHPARKCPPGARWVWGDERIYASEYEVMGKIPNESFFKGLEPSEILHQRR